MTTATGWQHWLTLPLVIGVAATIYVLVMILWMKWRGRKMKDTIVGIIVATAAATGAVVAVYRVFLGGAE